MMIFDRTSADVAAAVTLRKEKVQEFIELTEQEIEILEKGFLTINTLNRIESKQSELYDIFREMKYYSEKLDNKEWTFTDFFLLPDFERILSNLEKLRNAFFVYSDTPIVDDLNYRRYQTINAVERILYDLEQMVEDIKQHYRECGNYQCGEDEVD